MTSVQIRGDGVAAYCCAHLLRNAGFRVALERQDRPRVPAIMLGDQSVGLIRDVFERPNLFSQLPNIECRVVAWGDNAAAKPVPHSAVVVSEKYLLESLGCEIESSGDLQADFTIYTSGPMIQEVKEHRFGSRRAAAARVSLRDPLDGSACWIESLESGWLFLIPNGIDSTWLIGIGDSLEVLLAHSHVIAPRIEITSDYSAKFSSCPRMLEPLCGDSWLACGSAAMGFDPICGDGTAQAVREAILAAGVVRAIAEGGDGIALLSHYEMMLTASMRRHLALCADFYRSGGSGPWWRAELAALVEGYAWCTTRLANAAEPQYQLQGFELVKR